MQNSLLNSPDPDETPEPALPQAPASHMPMMNAMHRQAMAQLKSIQSTAKMLDITRREFDRLSDKGDAITSDDVMEGASALVAAGADPKTLVMMMAGNPQQGVPPMPDSGPALASWISQQEAKIVQSENQISPALKSAQHNVLAAALHGLTAHHIESTAKPPQNQPNPSLPSPLLQ